MKKEEIQQRVLQNGKPLDLDKFNWCELTRTFTSLEDDLVLDFASVVNCNIITGGCCTVKTGGCCTVTTGGCCTVTTRYGCTVTTGYGSTVTTGYGCTVTTGDYSTVTTGNRCTVTTGNRCTVTTEGGCTVTTGDYCTVTTGYDCTVTTEGGCTVTTGERCVIVRRDFFKIIQPKSGKKYQIAPLGVKGYLEDGIYSETGKRSMIIDGILSEVISEERNVYTVKNHGEDDISYIVKNGDIYSHGKTIKEASAKAFPK
jgi:hypothetical protein